MKPIKRLFKAVQLENDGRHPAQGSGPLVRFLPAARKELDCLYKKADAYGPMVEALRKAENMLRIHSGCNCADCIDDLGEVRTVLAQLPSESEVG